MQGTLDFAGVANEVDAAFADGRLYLIVDAQVKDVGWRCFYEGQQPGVYETGSIVHVMSKPAGGEIRGYLLIDGRLHLRLPSYTGDWPEMDAAVAQRVIERPSRAEER
ncbi:MAG: hypothetical protein AB7P99_04860 [Vicinamibacterales bacterium]